MEVIPVRPVLEMGRTLIQELWKLTRTKQDLQSVSKAVAFLVQKLEENIEQLGKERPHNNASAWALASLMEDLHVAARYVKLFMIWAVGNRIRISEELASLGKKLITSFQYKLQLVTLDVDLKCEKTQTEFQTSVQLLHDKVFERPSSSSDLKDLQDIQAKILKLLLAEVQAPYERVQQAVNAFHSSSSYSSETWETKNAVCTTSDNETEDREKMENENCEALQQEDDLQWYHDPITYDIMCDPVKASDGHTYDRWTLIDHQMDRSPFNPRSDQPFCIACDDVDVRGRLFAKFPASELAFRDRRREYREEALRKANGGALEEARVMLNHVLKWAESDDECLRKKEEVLNKMQQEQNTVEMNLFSNRPYSSWQDQRGLRDASRFFKEKEYQLYANFRQELRLFGAARLHTPVTVLL